MKIQQLLESQIDLTPWQTSSPERCRIILADKSATQIVGIKRQKSGRAPYVVFPGGGIEKTDKTPLATIERELREELGLDTSEYTLSNLGIAVNDEFGHQFYFLAEIHDKTVSFKMDGPESNRDITVSGTYAPQWYQLGNIDQVNFVPEDIKNLLHRGWNNAQSSTVRHYQKDLY